MARQQSTSGSVFLKPEDAYDAYEHQTSFVPRPGCHAGRLDHVQRQDQLDHGQTYTNDMIEWVSITNLPPPDTSNSPIIVWMMARTQPQKQHRTRRAVRLNGHRNYSTRQPEKQPVAEQGVQVYPTVSRIPLHQEVMHPFCKSTSRVYRD